MPIYEYKCGKCGLETEQLFKHRDRPATIECPCGYDSDLLFSAPARTAWSWGDTKWDGYHDRGLNLKLRDEAHRKAVMAKRGLREVQDGEVEREIARVTREKEEHDRQVSTFTKVMAETNNVGLAAERAFPPVEV
jgi:putative FmdB family regulatory protein